MQRYMLKSKLHRATVTDANLQYEGSITIDKALMAAADLIPFERVDVYNVNNGARFTTYVIEGEENSGTFCINGAAARLAARGDIIIVASYTSLSDEEARAYVPRCVLLDEKNAIKSLDVK
ncbi:MAG: aspartate 1-decarboxylase [Smithellaceae bacterium]|nr:aspartate 1-decarboxylase [Smithellaceae bacterium]